MLQNPSVSIWIRLVAGLIVVWVSGVDAEELAQSEKTTNPAGVIKSNRPIHINFVEAAQKGIRMSSFTNIDYKYNFSGFHTNTNGFTGEFNLYAIKMALEKALTSEGIKPEPKKTDAPTNPKILGPPQLDLNPESKSNEK